MSQQVSGNYFQRTQLTIEVDFGTVLQRSLPGLAACCESSSMWLPFWCNVSLCRANLQGPL